MEPLKVSRQNFPKSEATAEGMIVIRPACDNYELKYHPGVQYADRNGHELCLEIIEPVDVGRKTPLVVYIPGSAFRRQNVKERVAQLALLATRGYAVALLEYRGSDDAAFPALVLDAKAGVAFMKKNGDYNIDRDNVFLMGDSSGGYTSLMAGLTVGVESLEDELVRATDYCVRGIIDFYGPTDITTMNDEPSGQDHRGPDSPEGRLIGGYNVIEHPELSRPTIVKNYLHDGGKYPPVIMFHGSNDEAVPFSQSCELYTALKKVGGQAELYQIEGAHHGDRQFWSSSVLDTIQAFIEKNRKQ
ncbi:MAG: alpha/beta hydrolase [Clostridiales bacterium]|nr:alpha/beta hydrolase [Clostridiales bacterium]